MNSKIEIPPPILRTVEDSDIYWDPLLINFLSDLIKSGPSTYEEIATRIRVLEEESRHAAALCIEDEFVDLSSELRNDFFVLTINDYGKHYCQTLLEDYLEKKCLNI